MIKQDKKPVFSFSIYKIYIEKFNLEETNFRNVNAEDVSIKKAIEDKLVSIAEWKKYAWTIEKDEDGNVVKT